MSSTQMFKKENYRFFLIGLGLVALGYILMIGGGSDNPDTFNPEVFSFRRIILSPVIIVTGLLLITYGIMKKSK